MEYTVTEKITQSMYKETNYSYSDIAPLKVLAAFKGFYSCEFEGKSPDFHTVIFLTSVVAFE